MTNSDFWYQSSYLHIYLELTAMLGKNKTKTLRYFLIKDVLKNKKYDFLKSDPFEFKCDGFFKEKYRLVDLYLDYLNLD